MKKSILKISAGLMLSLMIGFTACEEDNNDDPQPGDEEPQEETFAYMSAYVEGDHGTLPEDYLTQLKDHFNNNGNAIDSTGMVSLSYDDILNTIVPASGEAGDGAGLSGDNFFDEVSYQGAFEPGSDN